MIEKNDIVNKALELGFIDIGFTTADSFDSQLDLYKQKKNAGNYDWISTFGENLVANTNPKHIFPQARSIIVLIEPFDKEIFPKSTFNHLPISYSHEDLTLHDQFLKRLLSFRIFLQENKIKSKMSTALPQKLAAARAGLGTFGKNCMFYSNNTQQGSWVYIVSFVVDHAFLPDRPTVKISCPNSCADNCILACPTGALTGSGKIDSKKCIYYLTRYADKIITPLELRVPMGLWVTGCDLCQTECPRNHSWVAKDISAHSLDTLREGVFDLRLLLHMSQQDFRAKRWHFEELWRLKMNVARVMGNSQDEGYLSDLRKAFFENDDDRVLGMIAWAVGRIGGPLAKQILNDFLVTATGNVKEEILLALE